MTGTLGLCSGSPRTEREPTTASRAPKRFGGAKDVFSRRNSPLLSPRPSIDAPTLSSIDAIMSLGKVEKVGRRDVVHSDQPFKVPSGNAQHCVLIETIQARLQLRKVKLGRMVFSPLQRQTSKDLHNDLGPVSSRASFVPSVDS